MKRAQHRSFVRPLDLEEYRFHCPSDKLGAPPYLVDLEAHAGRGECACRDWECIRHPNMRNGETELTAITCKHERRSLLQWGFRQLRQTIDPELIDGMSNKAIVAWAFKEVQRRVKLKIKQQRGKREQES